MACRCGLSNKLSGCNKDGKPYVWSKEELEILKEYYPTEGKSIVKRLPAHTECAIIAKAHKMHLYMNFFLWSEEEIQILKEYYPTEKGRVAKRLPKRSITAIRGKAQSLGLVKKQSRRKNGNNDKCERAEL